jgi:hypothetical protein
VGNLFTILHCLPFALIHTSVFSYAYSEYFNCKSLQFCDVFPYSVREVATEQMKIGNKSIHFRLMRLKHIIIIMSPSCDLHNMYNKFEIDNFVLCS